MDRIPYSQITPKASYLGRRAFLTSTLGTAGAVLACGRSVDAQQPAPHGRRLATVPGPFSTTEKPNTWEHATTYNNFYEFGTDKADPARLATRFKPRQPWTVRVEGECAKRGDITLDDLMRGQTLEERVYRLRCVEGWSMVIPWVGLPLAAVIKQCQPNSKAQFVEFTTLHDIGQFPGQRSDVLEWPYVEGLRLDEALHPLTILAVGIYGEVLPNQNGAPLRLVVPWKYGFKSIKSIVRIRFSEKQPMTSWMLDAPRAYGFYANVNPTVDHPGWTQSVEARLPSPFRNMRTQMFNGYGDQVARLYQGMDLRRNY
jgi:sulfoxide reductase catalytic subunit YedY